jgi:hypothetical protein
LISALKIWEGQSSYLLWQVKAANGALRKKFHLQASVEGNNVAIEIPPKKPEDLKPNGSLVSFLRKHAKTSTIKNIFHHNSSKNIWIPLARGLNSIPQLYILLKASRPAEIHIIDDKSISHFRRTSKNTFTKKIQFEEGIPDFESSQFTDILPELVTSYLNSISETDASSEEDEEATSHTGDSEDSENNLLPAFQRQARDKAARRLKTLRRSEKKLESQIADEKDIAVLRSHAKNLQTFLYLAKPDTISLDLEPAVTGLPDTVSVPLDPEIRPSQNLENYFIKIRKAERSIVTGTKKLEKLKKDLNETQMVLDQLRSQALVESEVEALLGKINISIGKVDKKAQYSTDRASSWVSLLSLSTFFIKSLFVSGPNASS